MTRSPWTKDRKREQQWTFMMVSDDGEVRSVSDGKKLRNLLTIFLAISIIAASVFYFLWDRTRRENEALRQAAVAYQKRLFSLGVDREELSALLAVYRPGLETPVDIPPVSLEEIADVESNASQEPAHSLGAPLAGTQVAAAPETKNNISIERDSAAPMVSPVGIENFQADIDKDSGDLTVEFKVTNIDPDLEKAEGHAILVLRPKEKTTSGMALPSMTLVGGRPTGEERGQAFSITNFKRIRFTAKGETQPERFKFATVYIFNEAGGIWMEEDFSIFLKDEG